MVAAVPLLAAPPAEVPARPPVQVTVRLVEVQVVAETKKGEPVTDLTQEDFSLFDKGHQEKITLFSAEALRPRETAAGPVPPNTFSNRLERLGGETSSVTAILFDGLNTRLTDQTYARRQIVRFIERIPPRDRVALYALGRGVNVLQDLTSDKDSLLAALKNYEGDLKAESEATLRDSMDPGLLQFTAWLNELKLNLVDYYAKDRALRTIRSLVAIANHLERVPGRKNLVWVSGSFPVWIGRDSVPLPEMPVPGRQTFWPEIERAARALNSSNLAIYPVDARGLMAPKQYSPERTSIHREAESSDWSSFRTMEVLAERTGGKAFFNSNDLYRAFERATKDSRGTYVLGFQPSHNQWNGKFRSIKVRVKRHGIRLRYRRGYFAQPLEPDAPWYRKGVLGAAMWSPLDSTQLGMTVHVVPAAAGALDLQIQLDANDVLLKPVSDVRQGKLDIWLIEFGAKNRLLKTASHLADLRLNPATYKRAMRTGNLLLIERLTPATKTALLRVLVRDVGSGALGSVTIPMEQIKPAAATARSSATGSWPGGG